MNIQRNIFAGLLIGFLTLCIPFYLRLIGVMSSPDSETIKEDSFPPRDVATSIPMEASSSVGASISTSSLLSQDASISLLNFCCLQSNPYLILVI